MPEINLPEFSAKIRYREQRKEIFDVFRNKFVTLTPEEWVRQHMLHFLKNHMNYPRGLIGVEVSLKLQALKRRADIVVYNRRLEPWMLVECKAMEVEMNQNVFDQAASYNLTLKVPYLVITNGFRLLAAKIDSVNRKIEVIPSLPDFPA